MPRTQPLGWRRTASNWIQAVREAVKKGGFLQKGKALIEGELPLCPLPLLSLLLVSYALKCFFPNSRYYFYFASSTWVWFGMAIHVSVTFRLNSYNGGWGWRQIGGSACANMTPLYPWEDEPLPSQALTFLLAPRLLAVVWFIRAMY